LFTRTTYNRNYHDGAKIHYDVTHYDVIPHNEMYFNVIRYDVTHYDVTDYDIFRDMLEVLCKALFGF
jgi:hypothetical protein